jgi:hypothetical protein
MIEVRFGREDDPSIVMGKEDNSMAQSDWSGFEKTVRGVVGDLKEVLTWSWDGRFEAALAEFQAGEKERVLKVLEARFDSLWEAGSLSTAPKRIVKLCKSLGGLRSGQMLLATDPNQDLLLLGAWWPWGNQKTISIRIIPTASNEESPEFRDFVGSLKGWFGI